MKNTRKIFLAVLAVVMLLTVMTFAASAAETEGIYTYYYDDYYGGIKITDVDDNATGDIVIPSTLGGEDVVALGWPCFKNCDKITSVVIPDTVKVLESSVFEDCDALKKVTMSDSVTNIEDNSFYNCGNLEEVILSDNIEHIGDSSFYKCQSLKNINTPSALKAMGGWVFVDCSALESFDIPSTITVIPEGLFLNSGIKEIKLHPGVTEIGKQAFDDCSELEILEIPGSVTKIGAYAFSDLTSLKTFKYYGTEENFKAACDNDEEYRYYKNTLKVKFEPCVSNHTNIAVIPATEPSCAEKGSTEGTKCADCGKIIVKPKAIDRLGHIDEDGDTICDRCGELAVEFCELCGDIAHETFLENLRCVLVNFIKLVKNFFETVL